MGDYICSLNHGFEKQCKCLSYFFALLLVSSMELIMEYLSEPVQRLFLESGQLVVIIYKRVSVLNHKKDFLSLGKE